MAISVEMLKEPKYLVIGGVAIVGGIYFASRLNKPKSAAPVEAPVSVQSVTSTDELNKSDDLQRQLADAQQQHDTLVAAQEEKDKAYQQNLSDYKSQFESERQQYESRLGALGSQFGNQIASLQALIQNLQSKIAQQQQQPTSLPGYNPPAPNQGNTRDETPKPTIPSQPTAPSQPTEPAKQRITIYPGVSGPDEAIDGYKGLLGTYEQVRATQVAKGQGNTITDRNMTAIAIYGTPTPWIFTGTWNLPEAVNQRRVKFSLRPLTSDEIAVMLNEVGRESKNGISTNLPALFSRWNAPYQVQSSKRF